MAVVRRSSGDAARRSLTRATVWSLLALACWALIGGGRAGAADATGRIVYAGRDGIYVATPDGAGQRIWQAPAGKTAAEPRWSPDGARIAFAGPDGNIWVMNADGAGVHAINAQAVASTDCDGEICATPGTVADSPRWSPDSASVSYRLVSDLARASIWTAPASGGASPQRIAMATDLCLFDEGWSPAGRPLFSRCASDSSPSNATYAAVDSTTRPVVAGSQLAYSPDGARLAFSSQSFSHGSFSVELFIANADGGGARLVADGGQNPAWSSAGLLAYRVSGADGWQIHVFDPTTGHDTALGEGAVMGWSPDGGWLVYTTLSDAGATTIWRMRPDGMGVQQLATGDSPDWAT